VSRIAKIIYAVKQDPDQYREQHGKCPRGYRFKDGKCVPSPGTKRAPAAEPPGGSDKPAEPSETAPKSKKKTAKPPKPKDKKQGSEIRKLRSQRQKAETELRELFDRDIGKYLERTDELRAQGVLPSREAAEKLAEIDDWQKLPEKVIRDPVALEKIVNQQAAQRAHEERMVKRKVDYLDDFMFKKELAQERGEKPPRLSLTKMARDLDKEMGRPVGKKFAKNFEKLSQTYRSGKAGSDPGSWAQRLKELMEGLVSPKWRYRIQGQVTASLSDPRTQDIWTLGFPPYAKPEPRVVLPDTRNRGFPPFVDDEGAVRPEYRLADHLSDPSVDRRPLMRGFPPYDTSEKVVPGPDAEPRPGHAPVTPLHVDNVGLPPYNAKPPRTKSYIPNKQPRPGFPPYNDGRYRVDLGG